LEQRAKLLWREKIIARQKRWRRDWRRRTTEDDAARQNDGNQKEKTSKESVFRQFLFFFFSEEEGTCTPAVRSTPHPTVKEVETWDVNCVWGLWSTMELASPWNPKEFKKNMAKM